MPMLAPPQEGKEMDLTTLVAVPSRGNGNSAGRRVLQRPGTAEARASPPPTTPSTTTRTPRRSLSSLLLTSSTPSPKPDSQVLVRDDTAERTVHSKPQESRMSSSSSFGKGYLSSMIGGLSLSLSRTSTRDSVNGDEAEEREQEKEKERGRALFKAAKRTAKSISQVPADSDTTTPATSRSRSRARSQSPFFFRRNRHRDSSPTIPSLPLGQSETDLSDVSSTVHPRHAYTDSPDSGDETVGETDYSDEDEDDIDDFLDPVTEHNTEQNSIVTPVAAQDGVGAIDEAEPDPLGEGVNVVVPPEPYFESTLNSGASATRNKRNPRRRKSVKHHDPLPHHTSRPLFQRDRATITITQGDPVGKLGNRRKRKYVVASDLSEESRYAVEWGIGTVLRDGDEMLVITVVENESKVDPETPNPNDRTTKLRSQQERQGLAYILVRQALSFLQRTRLNVTVACQAWHAKNSRHMLLDIVDYTNPQMLIVGSRGLGKLNGILLGSTSHYLIQKCSVPVMVARRRLKRPPKRSAHLSSRRQHVKLSEAGIDRVAAKVDQDVKVMRDEMQKEDSRRDGGPGSRDDKLIGSRRGLETVDDEEEGDEEGEDEEEEAEAEGVEGDVSAEGDSHGSLNSAGSSKGLGKDEGVKVNG